MKVHRMTQLEAQNQNLLTRLRDRLAGADGGFTLLETLAVMVIVGLLAAITIPQISKWRENAYVTALKSDAHNLSLALEAEYVEDQAYPETAAVQLNTPGTALAASDLTTHVQVTAYTPEQDSFSFTLGSTKTGATVTFDSDSGGIQD